MKHLELKEFFHTDLKRDFTPNEVEHIWNTVFHSLKTYIKDQIYLSGEAYRDEIDELEWEKDEVGGCVDCMKTGFKNWNSN